MKFPVSLILLFLPVILIAQPKAPVKWKEISMEEMQMKECEYEPDAAAVILYDYGQRYFDLNAGGQYLFLMNEGIVRIKILKESGLKYAKIKIPFHDIQCEKFFKENNISISARTYNLDRSGKIIVTKLKNKDINYKDSSNCERIAEFTFPNVKPGSVIEYRYKIPTLDMIYPKSWYFQHSIPIKYSEFRFFVPSDFQYTISAQNIHEFTKQEEYYYSKIIIYPGKTNIPRTNIDLSGKVMLFAMKNLPAFACKDFIYQAKDYIPKINIHLQRIQQRNQSAAWQAMSYPLMITTNDFYYTKTPEQRRMLPYPAGYIHQTSDWEELNNKMLKHHRFGMPLKLPWKDKGKLDSITQREKPEHEKMLDIYNFIRNEIKWDSTNVIYADRVLDPFFGKIYSKITNKHVNEKSLRKAFETKEGTNVEINFLLISLLRRMNVEAEPVLLSTRNHGSIDTNIHDVNQFNHVVARAKINNEYIFLDASDSLRPYNFIRKNSNETLGLLISENGHKWVNVRSKDITKNKINTELEILENNSAYGTVKNQLSGYDALDIRKAVLNQQRFTQNIIQTGLENTNIAKQKMENLNNSELPLVINSDLTIQAKETNKFVFQPKIDLKFTDENFRENFRACPVELDYPFEYNYRISIKYPENFEVKYPENLNLQMFGNNVQFKYSIDKKENEMIMNIIYTIKKARFPAAAYHQFERFIYQIQTKLKEKITVEKK